MEEITFVEGGKKRKGEKATCLQCGEEFVRRADAYGKRRNQKYCSKECSAKARENREELVCDNCGEKFERKLSSKRCSKHGVFFCSRKCKEHAQSLLGDCSIIRPFHYGSGDGYRNLDHSLLREKIEQGCVGCGEKRYFLLNSHHIDGNRSNNDLDNLEIVCKNCHSIRHLRYDEEKSEWIFSTKSLTPRDKLGEFYKV